MMASKGVRYEQTSISLVIINIYRNLNNSPLTSSYIKKLSYQYRMISPCDSKTIAYKTVGTCIISCLISIVSFIIIYLSNRRLITLITAVLAIYVINSELVSRIAKHHEIKVLIEMQKMLADIIHFYYMEYRIDDAIYNARDYLSVDMKAAVDQIYALLLSPDREEGLREYYDNIPNKYLRTFVSLCVGIMERGDQIHEGKLLFVRNLENLQRELYFEIDKLQRLNMEFMGVILCVISPIFCIDIVKQFTISLKEDMLDFYYGSQGFLLDIGLLLVIWAIYIIMHKSAEYTKFQCSSHKWLYRIDRISLIRRAMNNYCDKNASKQERLQRQLRNSSNSISARHFILRSFLIALSIFLLSIGISLYLHESFLSYLDLLVCLCISIIAFYAPRLILNYGLAVSKDAVEDEVNQFNALIGMLMYNESITVKQILVEMESFAMIFKQSLRICIDDYATGDDDALKELKEREPYEPFTRIIDNLIRCDVMPISQAFCEIQIDQDGYMSRRKLLNERSIRKRVRRAYLLAALPFLLLFTYGLMPALTSAIRELNQLLIEIEDISWY